jgi:MFS family permease
MSKAVSDAPEATSGVLAPRLRALTIGLVVMVAAAAFSRLGVSTALPAASAELDGVAWYGWVFTVFTLTNILGLSVAGLVFDRFGLVRPLWACTACFAAGLLVAAFAPSMLVVVLGRAFQGLGAGALSVAAYSAIAKGFPDRLRPAMLALNASAFTIPSLIGPVLAGLVAENLTWRLVFGILVPFVPVAAFLARRPLGRLDAAQSGTVATGSSGDNGRPVRRALGSGLALSTGLGGVLVAARLPVLWGAVAVVAGGVLLVIGARRLLPDGTFALRRGVAANVVFAAALSCCFFTVDLFIPLALTNVRGISATEAGLVLTAGIIGWTAGAFVPDRLARSGFSLRAIAQIGTLLVVAGLAVIAAVILSSWPVVFAGAGWVIAGFGAGIAFTTNSIAVLRNAPTESAGRASSQMELGNQAGIAIGTGLAGTLVGALGASATGLVAVFAVAACGGGLALAASSRFEGHNRA